MPKFCCKLMQLYIVQLIPGKAEITRDKGMYPRASGGRLISRDYYMQYSSTCFDKHSAFCAILWTLEFQLRFRVVDLFYL